MKVLFFLLGLFLVSSCQISRFVYYNFAGITDYKIFKERNLEKSTNPFQFHTAKKALKNDTLTDFLKDHKTVAFLVIQNDSILYENYFKGFDQNSLVASFSMAKSVTSLLIGCALEDGYIRSIDEPITNYIVELKDKPGFEKITIKHLLQMTSGIAFNENYFNPFSDVASFYYGTNLKKAVSKMKIKVNPEEEFKYVSGNTQVLGMVLHYALKQKSITQYLQEKIWTPLQMEHDASWSIDRKNGVEKTFCCINAIARDYAKIGRLMLQKGAWNGQQLVPKAWIEASTAIDTTHGSAWFYQYQWWFPSTEGDFMAKGFLGQYIYVNPVKNLVIIRLGKTPGKVKWGNLFVNMAKSL